MGYLNPWILRYVKKPESFLLFSDFTQIYRQATMHMVIDLTERELQIWHTKKSSLIVIYKIVLTQNRGVGTNPISLITFQREIPNSEWFLEMSHASKYVLTQEVWSIYRTRAINRRGFYLEIIILGFKLSHKNHIKNTF